MGEQEVPDLPWYLKGVSHEACGIIFHLMGHGRPGLPERNLAAVIELPERALRGFLQSDDSDRRSLWWHHERPEKDGGPPVRHWSLQAHGREAYQVLLDPGPAFWGKDGRKREILRRAASAPATWDDLLEIEPHERRLTGHVGALIYHRFARRSGETLKADGPGVNHAADRPAWPWKEWPPPAERSGR